MRVLVTLLFLSVVVSIMAQPKKPTLMILPSDNWCNQRYFMTTYSNQGSEVKIPNYKKAFIEDTELPLVISKVGEILTELGYSIKDAEMEIKSIYQKIAEENNTFSKTIGSGLQESPLDMLKRRIKSDILIQIWWAINKHDNVYTVSFTLEAFDTYTNKRIATSTSTISKTSDAISTLLVSAVKTNIHTFDKQMEHWYGMQHEFGREIVLTIKCWDNWEKDLETEYNGVELMEIIQNWLTEHTVGASFNLTDGSETFAQFEQVHISLYDDKGRALDARGFASELRKFLQSDPLCIYSKLSFRGLGEALLILGEK